MTVEDLAFWSTLILGHNISATLVAVVAWSLVAHVILKRSGAQILWASAWLAAIVTVALFQSLKGGPTTSADANLMINSIMAACAIVAVTAVSLRLSRDAGALLRTVTAAAAGVLALAVGSVLGQVLYVVMWHPRK